MFERFTDRARRVVVLAQEEARMLEHNYIGTEHLLLGLVHEGEGVAAQALTALGVRLSEVRTQVEEIVGEGHKPPTGHIPFTPRAKKVMELSLREALQLGHNYIGTEHILLGLIREGDGVAAQVLQKVGIDLDRARRQVIEILSGMGILGSSAAEAGGAAYAEVPIEGAGIEISEKAPACPRCGTALSGSLGIRTVVATGYGERNEDVRVAFCAACGVAIGVVL
jgi:ATP-dependent Clp protease ATP-binding subunit ClpC